MDQKKFTTWLSQQGAEVLAPTNPYEIARFRARGGVHVVYSGRRGISANGFAEECLTVFRQGGRLWMGVTKKPRNQLTYRKAALMERDGDKCFYCLMSLNVETATIEHLVSRDKSGPDHMDNLVLVHEPCNRLADNLPLIEKIKIRERRITADNQPMLDPAINRGEETQAGTRKG
jgi:hypothetical protein